jgi:hypothetical protein
MSTSQVQILAFMDTERARELTGIQRSWPACTFQRRYGRECNCDILLNGAGAGAYRTNDRAVAVNRYPTAKDDDFSGMSLLDTKEWFFWLSKVRQIRARMVEYAGGERLVDGEFDGADRRAILSQEGYEMPTYVNHRDAVRDTKGYGLFFCRG